MLFSSDFARPRPSREDDEVLREAIKRKLDDFIAWSNPKRPIDEEERQNWIDEIFDAAEHESEAFQIARNLDRRGWSADAALVELCDELDSERDAIAGEWVQKWVKESGVKPEFAVGDLVEACNMRSKGEWLEGEIIDVDEKRGDYTVRIPSLGHIERGQAGGTLGLLYPWESKLVRKRGESNG